MADATLDIMQHQGIGPPTRWVNDHHLFVWIRCEHVEEYNGHRKCWRAEIEKRGEIRKGGRLWFGGKVHKDRTVQEFAEDCTFKIKVLVDEQLAEQHDREFTYGFSQINQISTDLSISWEVSKDKPFASSNTYIGLDWDLDSQLVVLSEEKVEKYLRSVEEWRGKTLFSTRDV